MPHVQVVQVLPEPANRFDRVVRQGCALGQDQVPDPRRVLDDAPYRVVRDQVEAREVKVPQVIELLHLGLVQERERCRDLFAARGDEGWERRRRGKNGGGGRGEARVGDGGAGLEGELAEVVRGAEELEERDGGDTGAGDEVDFKEEGALEGEEDDGCVSEGVDIPELDLSRESGVSSPSMTTTPRRTRDAPAGVRDSPSRWPRRPCR